MLRKNKQIFLEKWKFCENAFLSCSTQNFTNKISNYSIIKCVRAIIRTRTGRKSTRFFLFLDLVSSRHTRKKFEIFYFTLKNFFLGEKHDFWREKNTNDFCLVLPSEKNIFWKVACYLSVKFIFMIFWGNLGNNFLTQ